MRTNNRPIINCDKFYKEKNEAAKADNNREI